MKNLFDEKDIVMSLRKNNSKPSADFKQHLLDQLDVEIRNKQKKNLFLSFFEKFRFLPILMIFMLIGIVYFSTRNTKKTDFISSPNYALIPSSSTEDKSKNLAAENQVRISQDSADASVQYMAVSTKFIKVVLKDKTGSLLINQEFKVLDLKGKEYSLKTDSQGEAYFSLISQNESQNTEEFEVEVMGQKFKFNSGLEFWDVSLK